MPLPFIKKIDPPQKAKRSTPLDVKKLQKAQAKDMRDPHGATVITHRVTLPHIDKYLAITIGSSIFFLAGLGFWIYVQFFLGG